MGHKKIIDSELQLDHPESHRVAIVRSRFNRQITKNLLNGAKQQLTELGLTEDNISVYNVPGAFEIPQTVANIKKNQNKLSGIITLGAVIRGDTPHFDYICESAAAGIQDIAISSGIPILFGVLTCDSLKQAKERSQDSLKHNKGASTARALVEMLQLDI